MAIRKIVIPKRYLKIAKQKGTRSLRDRETGQMRGRFAMKSGQGDSTKVRYWQKDVDVDGDKKPDYHAGEIFGRTTKVKGSNRARSTIRRF